MVAGEKGVHSTAEDDIVRCVLRYREVEEWQQRRGISEAGPSPLINKKSLPCDPPSPPTKLHNAPSSARMTIVTILLDWEMTGKLWDIAGHTARAAGRGQWPRVKLECA